MPERSSEVRYATINVVSTGSNPLVAGVAGYDVIVVNLELIVHASQVVTFEDSGTGEDRMGPWSFAAHGGISMPDSNVGWMRTAVGEGLNIRLQNANARVAGSIAYRLMPSHQRL